MKSSRAISCVDWLKITDVSGAISDWGQKYTLIKGAEMVRSEVFILAEVHKIL
jgi:hypothetical protein